MIDMLAKVLKKKFESGPMKVEIHVGKEDDEKGTDLAPNVKDKGEMSMIEGMLKGDPEEEMPMDRKPTFEERAKQGMRKKLAKK